MSEVETPVSGHARMSLSGIQQPLNIQIRPHQH